MSGAPFQVLSCGAGFDTSYFRLRNLGVLGDSCEYFEVDFPDVAREKAGAVLGNPMMVNLCLGQSVERRVVKRDGKGNLKVNHYSIIGCDLTRTEELRQYLLQFGFDFQTPTIVLCECSLTYVESAKASCLYRWLALNILDLHLIVYEQIRPHDRFGRIMKKHFRQRATPLLNVDDFPTLIDQERRLKGLGFQEAQAVSLVEIRNTSYGLSEKMRRKQLEPSFDELEESYLKSAHYSILEGITCSMRKPMCFPTRLMKINYKSDDCMNATALPANTLFRRYGHCCVIHDDLIHILGGNSAVNGRDSILATISLKDLTSQPIYSGSLNSAMTTFSACCVWSQDPLVVYSFGGRASPMEASDVLSKIDFSGNCPREKEIKVSGDRPRGRWKHSLDQIKNEVLVLVGGKCMESVFSDITVLDMKCMRWRTRRTIKGGIFSHSTAVWNDSQLVINGGLKSDETINDKFYLFDPFTGQLNKMTFPGIIPRFGHSSFVHESRLFLFGGVSAHCEPGLAVIDLMDSSLAFEYRMDLPRSVGSYNHAAAKSGSKVFITGGGGNCFSFGMHVGSVVLEIDLDRNWF